jgi:hypothetical protein
MVVPLGSLQLENGFANTVNQGQSTFDSPETLVRFGLRYPDIVEQAIPLRVIATGQNRSRSAIPAKRLHAGALGVDVLWSPV